MAQFDPVFWLVAVIVLLATAEFVKSRLPSTRRKNEMLRATLEVRDHIWIGDLDRPSLRSKITALQLTPREATDFLQRLIVQGTETNPHTSADGNTPALWVATVSQLETLAEVDQKTPILDAFLLIPRPVISERIRREAESIRDQIWDDGSESDVLKSVEELNLSRVEAGDFLYLFLALYVREPIPFYRPEIMTIKTAVCIFLVNRIGMDDEQLVHMAR